MPPAGSNAVLPLATPSGARLRNTASLFFHFMRGNRRPPARVAPIALQHRTVEGLRLLAFLRVFAPLAQAATLLFAIFQYGVEVPLVPLSALLAIEAFVAAATWVRVHRASRVSAVELLLQVQLDIVLLAAMLYLTGGLTSPFAPLFVLPLAIAASALEPRWVGVTAISTVLATVLLRQDHAPLFRLSGMAEVHDLYETSMGVSSLLAAALLAFLCHRMHAELQRQERTLADARDAQMRNESVTAIGALAAGHAHELSSPLATMAVVVAELKRKHAADAELSKDLKLIEDQLEASKQTVSNLVGTFGRRRAEAATRARLDEFVRSIVERARVRHPGAAVVASLDSATAPPWIVAEETLRHAITNLIDNAILASPRHVEVHADWSGADLRVTVQDRGTGFDAEMLKRAGKYVGITKGAAGGGMGLGLLLSAATLERLGGSLELTNQPNGGARCEICVPLRAIEIKPTGSSDQRTPSV